MSAFNQRCTAAIVALSALSIGSVSAAEPTADKKIAFSISYAGNAMRQGQISSWKSTTASAIADKVIAGSKVVTASNGAPEQASQIETLMLDGTNAIVINAGSPTALNGVIAEACAENIVVVLFDGIATAPCAYKLEYDWKSLGTTMATFVVKELGGKGNILENRGLAGISIDDDMHSGAAEVFAKYPDIKVVAAVYGQWTPSVTQKEISAILPSLPRIDAVISQGGGFGAFQAFAASGRKQPIMIYGNYQEEIKAWSESKAKDPSYKAISLSSSPTVSAVAFWVAQEILAGKTVPKTIQMPLAVLDPNKLGQWLAKTPEGGVASPDYTRQWTEQLVAANVNHTALPDLPDPK